MNRFRARWVSAILTAVAFGGSAWGASIWSAGANDLTFTKPSGADPIEAVNQDRITSNVWLTRGISQGLFNIKAEEFFSHGASPMDTEWAFSGLNGDPTFAYGTGAVNHANLTFDVWETSLGGRGALGSNIVGAPGVLHLITDDIYIDIRFNSPFGSGFGDGTFSYTRGVAPAGGPVNATWNGGPGNWGDATKWSSNPSFPNNGTPSGVTYAAAINSGVVNLNVNATINSLALSGATLTGSSALALLTGGSVNGAYNLTGGTTIAGGALVFSGGSSTAGSFGGAGNLTVEAAAALVSRGLTVNQWTIGGTHTIQLGSGDAGTSKVNGLSVASSGGVFSGKLDLNNNLLIVEATDAGDKATKIAQLNLAIAAGSNGGTWTGKGITSGTAAGDPNHLAVGVFDNALFGAALFGGIAVDGNSILVAVSHLGDANRNGVVDIQDLTIVGNNWTATPGHPTLPNNWTQGDLNRDGVVDIQDFTIVANNWQQTGISLGPAELTAVPEPGVMGMFVAGMVAIGIRRPKR